MSDYDYIVVGAGTAGCVLAARLSEDPDAQVLLLEAGSARLPALAVAPPAWPMLLGTEVDWSDSTETQEANGLPMHLPRGRGLGGSSSTNAMFFIRGHRSSYDAWEAAGAKGWGFDDLLPYFKRSERLAGRDPAVRGTQGPLTPAHADPLHPVVAAQLAAAVEVGHPLATDISSGVETGFGPFDMSIVDGKRQSAADAYLTPASQRPNLTVVSDATATRVITANGRATGVEYRVGDETHRASSREEIVLTAGAIGSPQLLLLSGIGPKTHLKNVGVDTMHNLPGVGSNLQDHPLTQVAYEPSQPLPPMEHNHSGALGLLRSSPDVDAPDLQIVFSDIALYGPAVTGPQGYAILVSAMLPRSRGSLLLRSSDPSDRPRIDPRYYDDHRDIDVMEAGLRIAREIGNADALAPWRGEEVAPGPDVKDSRAMREYVSRSLLTYMHPVGTCRMGEDDAAVVDTQLRVHGIHGLRVADASVMPTIVSANTNATVYAIAERAAAMIRGKES